MLAEAGGAGVAGVGGVKGRPTIVGLTAASSARRLHASEHLDYLGTLLGYTHTHTLTHICTNILSHIHTHSLRLVNISCCHSVLSVRKHQAELRVCSCLKCLHEITMLTLLFRLRSGVLSAEST